jgi:hypothetical protein
LYSSQMRLSELGNGGEADPPFGPPPEERADRKWAP